MYLNNQSQVWQLDLEPVFPKMSLQLFKSFCSSSFLSPNGQMNIELSYTEQNLPQEVGR